MFVTTKTKRFSLLSFVFASACMLSACATYNKCGFSGCPGDAKITADVQSAFNQHTVLMPPNLLAIQTLDHVVYLTGFVDTDRERLVAESVALEVPGVARVVNSIAVRGWVR